MFRVFRTTSRLKSCDFVPLSAILTVCNGCNPLLQDKPFPKEKERGRATKWGRVRKFSLKYIRFLEALQGLLSRRFLRHLQLTSFGFLRERERRMRQRDQNCKNLATLSMFCPFLLVLFCCWIDVCSLFCRGQVTSTSLFSNI